MIHTPVLGKRGDIAVIRTVTRIAYQDAPGTEHVTYSLAVVTSITRDSHVKAVRMIDSASALAGITSPIMRQRMGEHGMLVISQQDGSPKDALAWIIAERATDNGYLAPFESAIDTFRALRRWFSLTAPMEMLQRLAADEMRADRHQRCHKCGVYTRGRGTVTCTSDDVVAECAPECPRGVDYATDYPVGTEIKVTSGFAQYLTAHVISVTDYAIGAHKAEVPPFEYAGRSYELRLPGYGLRMLGEAYVTPVDADLAARYAVNRETPESSTEQTAPAASADPSDKPAAPAAPVKKESNAMSRKTAATPTNVKIDAVELKLTEALEAVRAKRFATARALVSDAEDMAPAGYKAGTGNVTFGVIRAQVTRAEAAHLAMEAARNGGSAEQAAPAAEQTPAPAAAPAEQAAPAAKRAKGTVITHTPAGTLLANTPYPLRFRVSSLLNAKRGGLGWTFSKADGAWVLNGSTGQPVNMARVRAAVAALATLDVETAVNIDGWTADGPIDNEPVPGDDTPAAPKAPAAKAAPRTPAAELPSVDTVREDVHRRAAEAAGQIAAALVTLDSVKDGLTDAERAALAAAYRRALASLIGESAEQAPAAPAAKAKAPKAKAPAAPAVEPAPAAPAAPAVDGTVTFTLPEFSVSGEVYGASVAAIGAAIEAAGHAGVTVKRVARKGEDRRKFTVAAPAGVDSAAVTAIAAQYLATLESGALAGASA